MSTFTHDPDALGSKVLSVALIGPQEQRRKAVASALAGSQASVTREFTTYPGFDDVPGILDSGHDGKGRAASFRAGIRLGADGPA